MIVLSDGIIAYIGDYLNSEEKRYASETCMCLKSIFANTHRHVLSMSQDTIHAKITEFPAQFSKLRDRMPCLKTLEISFNNITDASCIRALAPIQCHNNIDIVVHVCESTATACTDIIDFAHLLNAKLHVELDHTNIALLQNPKISSFQKAKHHVTIDVSDPLKNTPKIDLSLVNCTANIVMYDNDYHEIISPDNITRLSVQYLHYIEFPERFPKNLNTITITMLTSTEALQRLLQIMPASCEIRVMSNDQNTEILLKMFPQTPLNRDITIISHDDFTFMLACVAKHMARDRQHRIKHEHVDFAPQREYNTLRDCVDRMSEVYERMYSYRFYYLQYLV